MGLSDLVARSAARHAHALVVEVPGWWRTRASVERAILTRGWRLAFSPADADVLVVCGAPGSRLEEAVTMVWHQMPGPRVRVDVREYDDVTARLEEAHSGLLDTDRHRRDADHRPAAGDLLDASTEKANEDHEGHEDHEDHGGMDMAPCGIPLAEGGPDRDGLEMDVLDVRLGPVLPHWPAGLVVRCSLQGDLVTEAQAELLAGDRPRNNEATPLARRLDNLASVLALAGWDVAAAEARGIRDAVLQGAGETVVGRVGRLSRTVRRSWTLRWSLRGIRPLSEEDVRRHGLPAEAVGDTYDRLRQMLDRAATDAAGDRAYVAGPVLAAEHVAHLVTGLDLATARLVVASLDVHELRGEHASHEVSHG